MYLFIRVELAKADGFALRYIDDYYINNINQITSLQEEVFQVLQSVSPHLIINYYITIYTYQLLTHSLHTPSITPFDFLYFPHFHVAFRWDNGYANTGD